jgi:hypothetical protein
MRVSVVCAALVAASAPAMAQGGMDLGPFACTTIEDFLSLDANFNGVKINYFAIREIADPVVTGMFAMQVTFSVSNMSKRHALVSADLILFDAQHLPLAAVSASPFPRTGSPGTVSTALGQTFVEPGTVAKVRLVCLRLFGGLRD